MRDKIISKCLKTIQKKDPNIDNDELEKIEYGLVGIYILITKLIIIFALALILGIYKEVFIFFIIYAIIRSTSFGLHASKSWICLIVSIILMIGVPYISLNIIFPFYLKPPLCLICTLLIGLYSPADTAKRPIINHKRRMIYKTISISLAIIYTITCIFISNNYISNCLIFALIIQSIIILPITYKFLKEPYNNYKNYIK